MKNPEQNDLIVDEAIVDKLLYEMTPEEGSPEHLKINSLLGMSLDEALEVADPEIEDCLLSIFESICEVLPKDERAVLEQSRIFSMEKLFKSEPTLVRAVNLARLYEAYGDYEAAIKVMEGFYNEKLLIQEQIIILSNLATFYSEMGNFDKIVECCDHLTLLKPSVETYLTKAEVLNCNGKASEALQEIEKAFALKPESNQKTAKIWSTYADILFELMDYEKCYQALKCCLQFDPLNGQALTMLEVHFILPFTLREVVKSGNQPFNAKLFDGMDEISKAMKQKKDLSLPPIFGNGQSDNDKYGVN